MKTATQTRSRTKQTTSTKQKSTENNAGLLLTGLGLAGSIFAIAATKRNEPEVTYPVRLLEQLEDSTLINLTVDLFLEEYDTVSEKIYQLSTQRDQLEALGADPLYINSRLSILRGQRDSTLPELSPEDLEELEDTEELDEPPRPVVKLANDNGATYRARVSVADGYLSILINENDQTDLDQCYEWVEALLKPIVANFNDAPWHSRQSMLNAYNAIQYWVDDITLEIAMLIVDRNLVRIATQSLNEYSLAPEATNGLPTQ